MAYSMTGFGSAKAAVEGYDVEVQVKTLNNRALDVHVNMPNMPSQMEVLYQRLVRQFMGRGRVDISVRFVQSGQSQIGLNQPLIESRIAALRALTGEAWSRHKCLEICMQQRDVWEIDPHQTMSEGFCEGVLELSRQALDATNKTRRAEGQSLEAYLINALDEIDSSRQAALERDPERIAEYRRNLSQRISEILQNRELDENRIAMEVAMMADKLDVTEELTRIATHLSALRILILSPVDPLACIGKKIDFYLQELNREATTMASKSRDSILTKHTIDIRTKIESIREQAANIQ